MPLPLSLAEVEARLAGKYYRQLAAVVHDLQVIAENAVMFNGADSGIAQDAKGPPSPHLSCSLRAIRHHMACTWVETISVTHYSDMPSARMSMAAV